LYKILAKLHFLYHLAQKVQKTRKLNSKNSIFVPNLPFMEHSFKFFISSGGETVGQEIARLLNITPGKLYTTTFSDGEVYTRFDESIRGEVVVLFAPIHLPYTNLFELFVTIDAARRASAKEIICILPYLPHSRQERKDDTRSSVSARLIADFIEHSGADRIVTIDMHSTSIEGFYKIPIDHISMNSVFIDYIHAHFEMQNLCVCSPDFGGLKRIRAYKNALDCEMAVIHKERLQPNKVNSMEIIGDVNGKDVVIIDDMVDTGGTLCLAAEILKEAGAKSVHALCTHGVLSGNAIEKVNNSALESLIVSDTIPLKKQSNKIKTVSSAGILASSIQKILNKKSLKS